MQQGIYGERTAWSQTAATSSTPCGDPATLAAKNLAGSGFMTSPLGRAHDDVGRKEPSGKQVYDKSTRTCSCGSSEPLSGGGYGSPATRERPCPNRACCCNELALHGRLVAHFKQLQGLLPWPGTAESRCEQPPDAGGTFLTSTFTSGNGGAGLTGSLAQTEEVARGPRENTRGASASHRMRCDLRGEFITAQSHLASARNTFRLDVL